MTDYACPGCTAHGMADECFHSEEDWTLAEAMLEGVTRLHGRSENNPDPTAWDFADDAEALNGSVGSAPYIVDYSHPGGGQYDTLGLVNGRYLFGATDDVADFLGDISGLIAGRTPSDIEADRG